ncbi:hypothetical protein PIB30_074433 [Stylosanthes scabra]|uniref:Uncharacterized protein n=1 Tax=Stylosanthes scabra TaxID=79078 RepID=A0ABU6RPI3_9FABA|nr:hypothetical protein [Stylosanthes scabra]
MALNLIKKHVPAGTPSYDLCIHNCHKNHGSPSPSVKLCVAKCKSLHPPGSSSYDLCVENYANHCIFPGHRPIIHALPNANLTMATGTAAELINDRNIAAAEIETAAKCMLNELGIPLYLGLESLQGTFRINYYKKGVPRPTVQQDHGRMQFTSLTANL